MLGIRVRFTVPPIIVLLGSLALVAALTLWYLRTNGDGRATLQFAAVLVGAAVAIFTLLQGRQTKRVSAALRFIERWNSPDLVDLRKGLRDLLRQAEGLPLVEDPGSVRALDRRTTIVWILNFFEEMSIAVQSGEVDETVLRDFFRTAALKTYAALEGWVKEHRPGHPTAFTEFERLCRKWRESA
jgi:hypothetical protein